MVFPDITYSFYPSYCRLCGLTHTTLALTDDFEIELAAVPRSARALIFRTQMPLLGECWRAVPLSSS